MNRKTAQIGAGLRHLRQRDAIMRRLIEECPPPTDLRLERDRFFALANSILSQQISVHAARAIKSRLSERIGAKTLTPEAVMRLGVDELRATGISRQKATYLLDLSEKVASGALILDRMPRMTDDRVITELVKVRGIGVWTAQMFLIFSLGRLDVLPVDDYGIRAAIQKLYDLDALPDKTTSMRIAEPWRPYATIASWYCWRSHELDAARSRAKT